MFMAKKPDAKKVSIMKVAKKESCGCGCDSCNCKHVSRGTCGAIYGLGVIGAAIYYISTASSFWMGVLGVLKSIVWPVFFVFGLLKFLGA